MFQVATPLGHLPIALLCRSDASVVFAPQQEFKTVVDTPSEPDDVVGMYDMDGFSLNGEKFLYNCPYAYKNIPVMLQWLKQQDLISPI